jgi:cob(I)alamin adenosyltransferase
MKSQKTLPKKASITTRVGDRGTTFLFSGEEVAKDGPRTEAYGDLDELVSVLGLARATSRKPFVRASALALQRRLFLAGTELATSARHVGRLRSRIDAAALAAFETERDALEARVPMPAGFILPGGTPAAAALDVARALSRRLERKVVGLARRQLVRSPHLLVWLNRLSDYLWLLARYEEGRKTLLK